MKSKSVTTIGALHPILFFVGVYAVALFFSIFICSSLFYSCQSRSTDIAKEQKMEPQKPASPNTVTTAAVNR